MKKGKVDMHMKNCFFGLGIALSLSFSWLASPLAAQTLPSGSDLGGVWLGGSATDGLELRLEQVGDFLQGPAVLNRASGGHIYGEVSGQLSPDGVAQLAFDPTSELDWDELSLNVRFQSDGEATVDVFDGEGELFGTLSLRKTAEENPADPDARFRLWDNIIQPFTSLSPNEQYRVEYVDSAPGSTKRASYSVHLQSVVLTEIVGRWDIEVGHGLYKYALQEGRVAAWNFANGDSIIAFKDFSSLLRVTSVVFPRFRTGSVGSRILGVGGLQRHYTDPDQKEFFLAKQGEVTLVRP